MKKIFPGPKKEKQTLPFMLEIPYKEQVKKEVCRLCDVEIEGLDARAKAT